MKLPKALALILVAVSLGGCANFAYSAVKALYGDSPYTRDAVKATAVAMSAYDKGLQPQIERYMDWPKKGTPECAAMKTTLLCRDQKIAERLAQADAVASAAIHKARLIIDGVAEDDTGTALTDAVEAIRATEAEYFDGAVPEVVP